MVKVGSTRLRVASEATVASAAPVPSALNETSPCLIAPTSRDSPTIPLIVIITAANTVSRASVSVPGPPETISVTMSATSITVTATASTSDPYGSPDPVRDHLGVVHRGQHRRAEDHRHHGDQHRARVPAPGRGQREDGHDRHQVRPGQQS